MKEIKKITEIVDDLIEKEMLNDELLWTKIKNIWEQEMSAIYKKNIKLVVFLNGTLYLWTDTPVWRKEVQLRSKELITGLNNHLKSNKIKYLKI